MLSKIKNVRDILLWLIDFLLIVYSRGIVAIFLSIGTLYMR